MHAKTTVLPTETQMQLHCKYFSTHPRIIYLHFILQGVKLKMYRKFLQLFIIGTHKSNFTGNTYPCAEAVIEYFPGTRSLQ